MHTENRPCALITGASRGIGRSIAFALAAEGYDLILTCSRTPGELNKVKEEILSSLPVPDAVSIKTVVCDAGSSADTDALFAGISRLDLLVNNAGISIVKLVQDMTDEEWERILRTNLTSVFNTSRRAIPLFLRQGTGRVINISSVWGNVGASTEAAYSATKGGVNAFTRALAKELAPNGIPVNAIACGCIDTSMNNCFTDEEKQALAAEIPADRFGTPEEVAQEVLLLAKAPSYLTGQVITMDGGWI